MAEKPLYIKLLTSYFRVPLRGSRRVGVIVQIMANNYSDFRKKFQIPHSRSKKLFMSRLDAIAIVSTGIVSSLLTLSLRAAPALGQTENFISNVIHQRTLPVKNTSKSEFQTVVFADISHKGARSQIGENGKLLALAAVGVSSTVVIWGLNRQNKPLSPKSALQETKNLIEQANPRLRQELLRLVGGDRQTANRLIAGVKQSHPEKSINWAVEKAIYDLERDR